MIGLGTYYHLLDYSIIMKYFSYLFISSIYFFLILISGLQQTQAQVEDYWQQEVNTTIEVTLNDEEHSLTGFIQMEYINHSPYTLNEIYFHLWPNAYKNQQTAFAKQQLEARNTKFYYSKSKDRGYIDKLEFRVDKKEVTWSYFGTYEDIARLTLNEAIQPGESVLISTPFYVKIPNSYSRLGHVGQSYQLTQWFPKPAVLDEKGWHTMPYLDQGEFYYEYGTYDVKITLPKNYVVGATGVLQNEDEIAWLNQKASKTKDINEFDAFDTDFPPSDSETKTLHYIQDNVHDFAWFADKRFHVLKGNITLPNTDNEVTTWAMFTNKEAHLWKDALTYINQGLAFYSEKIGDYPYSHCTAVESALSAGGGMEYPMITVIGQSGSAEALEEVIVHEVGHNWFQGMLGSNERAYAWMDEGINTYYDNRYIKETHPKEREVLDIKNKFIDKLINYPEGEYPGYVQYWEKGLIEKDQPIQYPAGQYTGINYYSIVYGKAAQMFYVLENYLGQTKLDKAMQSYFQQYKYKHPQPQDLKRVLEEETGKYYDWLFDDLIVSKKKIDYKIDKVKKKADTIANKFYDQITVHNGKSGKNASCPYPITAYKNGKPLQTIWFDGFSGTMPVLFPSIDYDKLVIDENRILPEINRKNNVYKPNSIIHRPTKLKFGLLGGYERPNERRIFLSPAIAWNNYDKFMFGIAFYNSLLVKNRFEFALAPMYATMSKSLAGTGRLAYNWYPRKGLLDHIQIAGGANIFSFDNFQKPGNPEYDNPIRYYRFTPEVNVRFRNQNPRAHITRVLSLRHINIQKNDEKCIYNCDNDFRLNAYYINELAYRYENNKVINPYRATIKIQQGSDSLLLASVESRIHLNYSSKKRHGFDIRFFAGGFLMNGKNHTKYLTLYDQGSTDFVLDDLYMGRTETDGILYKQMYMRYGGFKVPIKIGRSDKFLVALNLESSVLPVISFVKLYADVGSSLSYDLSSGSDKLQLFFNAGLQLELLKNRLEVNFPLLHSKNISAQLKSKYTFLKRIIFHINIAKLNPVGMLRKGLY